MHGFSCLPQLFNNTIESSEKADDLEARIQILLNETTMATYNNVARGLFEKDKLVFSFMLCGEIMKQENLIHLDEWNYFLRGSGGMDRQRPPMPSDCGEWLTEAMWVAAVDLADFVPHPFKTLPQELQKAPVSVSVGSDEMKLTIQPNPDSAPTYEALGPAPSDEEVKAVRLLALLRISRPPLFEERSQKRSK